MTDSYEDKMTISITNTCNINCIYCYSNKDAHHKQVIPLNFTKIGIKDFFNTHESRKIKFFGSGEPTTEIDLIKNIVDYARSISEKELELEIQTNGVFSKNTAKWLAKNFTTIYISSDGTPETQNYYRPAKNGKPTSDILEKNLKIIQKYGNAKIAIRATIGNKNIKKQKELIDYFKSFGVKYIWTRPIFPPPIGNNTFEQEIVNMDLYIEEYINAKKYADDLGIFYGSFLSCNFDSMSEHYCNATKPLPLLTTDGYVSSCDNVLFGENSDIFSFFIYGKWDKEKNIIQYSQSKINALRQRTVDNLEGCHSCSIKYQCGGHCLAEILEDTGSIYNKNESLCYGTQKLFSFMPKNISKYECRYP